MANIVFDLDGTVIDSSHRHATNSDGSIDLAHWFENATPDKIRADSLLPLAEIMREHYANGDNVIVCTARCMSEADMLFLWQNNLPFHFILSRQGYFVTPDDIEFADSYHGFIGDNRGDGEMKVALLTDLAITYLGYDDLQSANFYMFDDNLRVIQAMLDNRVVCVNATNVNAMLAA